MAAPIYGRTCQNPNCRVPIDPGRRKGANYCDSSCRAEASRLRHPERYSKAPTKARRRAPVKHRRAPRKVPVYSVYRMENGPLLLRFVGIVQTTTKAKAREWGAAADEDGRGPEGYLAIPNSALNPPRRSA